MRIMFPSGLTCNNPYINNWNAPSAAAACFWNKNQRKAGGFVAFQSVIPTRTSAIPWGQPWPRSLFPGRGLELKGTSAGTSTTEATTFEQEMQVGGTSSGTSTTSATGAIYVQALKNGDSDYGTVTVTYNAGGLNVAPDLTAPAGGGLTEAQAAQLTDLHKLQGLDPSAPMTVTPTSRVAGDLVMTISGDGTTTATVTRV